MFCGFRNCLDVRKGRKLPYVIENDLEIRKDIVIKAADKSGAVVVWRADLCHKEALRQLSGTSFYAKVDKDLTLITKTLSKMQLIIS